MGSIGGTPLLLLESIARSDGRSPGALGQGGVSQPERFGQGPRGARDRPGGVASGALGGGRTLLDATSGNTGVAYAMLGARLGFSVALYVPRNASPDRLSRMRALGAKVVLTDAGEGTDGAQREARRDGRGGTRPLLLRRSVPQSREPRGSLRHHRAGDVAQSLPADHASCRGRGHRRNDLRNGTISEGAGPFDPSHRRRTDRSDARARGSEAPADRRPPVGLRRARGRRDGPGGDRRRRADGRATRPRGGDRGRSVLGGGRRGGAPVGSTSRARRSRSRSSPTRGERRSEPRP